MTSSTSDMTLTSTDFAATAMSKTLLPTHFSSIQPMKRLLLITTLGFLKQLYSLRKNYMFGGKRDHLESFII
jgi:hypothetical protein